MSIVENGKVSRVVCAMSGGVDSSVAAVLLKNAGFEVIGVFMKFWVQEVKNGICLPENRCCSEESERQARETALRLGIPFYVLDLRAEFKAAVVDNFIAGVKAGLTPNPCVVCNKDIKFGLLIERAARMGADYVATGHYAQIKKSADGQYHLFKGKDKGKDQSYFLWQLSQKKLARIIFPVGCFDKSDVRGFAKMLDLPAAESLESQEACFANGNMEEFLAVNCGVKPGNIVDECGNMLGRHNGLWFYTIGQRKGIKLSGGPYYVIAKNKRKNELVVSREQKTCAENNLSLKGVSWIGAKPSMPLGVKVKIRYRAKEIGAVLRQNGSKLELGFNKPQFAVTPGQSAAFYRGRELLGGGVICGKV